MKRKVLLSLSSFVIVLLLHASYTILQSKKLAERWVVTNETNYVQRYLASSEYLIGASYALAIGFSVFALLRFSENQKKGIAGLIGGITLTGALYVAGCFLLGCCGSPMLAVYLTLFGSSFLGFTKPLTFVLTSASIIVGYIWMSSRGGCALGAEQTSVRETTGDDVSCACEGDEECKPK